MTDQTAPDRLRAFLDYEEANGAGGDDVPVYDVGGYDLTYGDLREVLALYDNARDRAAELLRSSNGYEAERDQLKHAATADAPQIAVTEKAAAAIAYLRPFLGLSDEMPDGPKQDAPVQVWAVRALLREREQLLNSYFVMRHQRDTMLEGYDQATADLADTRAEADALVNNLAAARAERDQLRRHLDAAPALTTSTAWWFDTGEFDYDPPKLYNAQQLAQDAAIEHWKHFNFPREVEFGWLQEPDDPEHPDPSRGFELVAAGRETGHIVRPLTVQGAPQPDADGPATPIRHARTIAHQFDPQRGPDAADTTHTTWTAPDGTTYDLKAVLTDRFEQTWSCEGWLHRIGSDEAWPLMIGDLGDHLEYMSIRDAIAVYGPLTATPADATTPPAPPFTPAGDD